MSTPTFRMHVAINVRSLEENLKFAFESASEPVAPGVCCSPEPVQIQFGNLEKFKK